VSLSLQRPGGSRQFHSETLRDRPLAFAGVAVFFCQYTRTSAIGPRISRLHAGSEPIRSRFSLREKFPDDRNIHARPYQAAFNEFRREVIRFLTSTPKEQMTPAALHVRLRAKFSWYQYFGN
jgi:hypothetical protein